MPAQPAGESRVETCAVERLREEVIAIHGGRPERFTLPCNFRASGKGVHSLLVRGAETIAVGSSSSDGSSARLITTRTDRPPPSCHEFRELLMSLGGSGEVVIEESLAPIACDACREIDGTELRPRFELSLYRYEGGTPTCEHPDPAIRAAGESDVPLLAGWARAFDAETGFSRPGCQQDFESIIRGNLSTCHLMMLELDGTPVAMGQRARTSWCGQNRIGLIFVPPEHRSHGHARRMVRSLIASILDDEAVPCLFTDRSNPISNRLYTGLSFVRSEYLVHLTHTGDV